MPGVIKPDLPFVSQSLLGLLGDTLQPEYLDSQEKKEVEIVAVVLFQSKDEGEVTNHREAEEKDNAYPRFYTAGLLFLIRRNISAFE